MRAGPYWPATVFREHLLRRHGANRPQQLGTLVPHRIRLETGARLHPDSRHHLQQVILNHVRQRAGLLVIGAAALHSESIPLP